MVELITARNELKCKNKDGEALRKTIICQIDNLFEKSEVRSNELCKITITLEKTYKKNKLYY